MYDQHDDRSSGYYSSNRGHRGGHNRGRGRGNYNRNKNNFPLTDLDPELTDMSRRVIGAAIEVHKALGPGYPLEVYTKALMIELDANEIDYATNHQLDVTYKDKKVGEVTTDLFVGNRFIVGLLARVGQVGTPERSALRAQLRAADLELGLVINFGERRLKDGLVRVLNPDKLNALRAAREELEAEEEEDDDEYEYVDEDDEEYEDDDEYEEVDDEDEEDDA